MVPSFSSSLGNSARTATYSLDFMAVLAQNTLNTTMDPKEPAFTARPVSNVCPSSRGFSCMFSV